MKTYAIECSWLFKGRYPMADSHRVKASGIRAAVGKALAAKRKGYREMAGTTMTIRITVIGNGVGKEE